MTRDPWKAPLRRRELLQGGAGLALGLGLAGCGVGNQEQASKEQTERVVEAKVDGDLVYFNWSEYLEPKLIKAFEKQYGVKVRESNFDSMQGMMAKLRSGNRYDLIFPSSEWVDRLRKANQLLRIDLDQLPNADTVYDYFATPWYDPQADHTVPYAMYATGIIYRADKIGDMSGSWNDMVNPTADGRAFLLDDFQEVIGAGNLVSGAELNSVDEGDVEKAKEWALSVKPKLRGFSTDDVQNMVSGNAWIHHGWNGDVVNIRNQVDKPENYSFQKCSEGIPLGTDCFAIPANAEHPGTALTFINFILDPENASKNIEYMGYPMPYTGPDETFAGLVKDDPAINVTVEDLESGQQFENLGAEGRRLWDRTWTEIKAG
ncbi:MAG TPA: spermidine/putrescine ABC transporter substrate-binding protein [Solirubrobacteraceae bacterium]|jgi:spermidine/putrescine transport system substrate-binding protein|nr:spermidine/putrescine ABC transporter substrate-binding protein [Solirubrobacteraceae bacterium]